MKVVTESRLLGAPIVFVAVTSFLEASEMLRVTF